MSEGPAASVKVCAGCSKDVSKLPRTKDAKGRYLCQDCLAKMKAKAGAEAKPAPVKVAKAAPVEVDVMSNLLSETTGVELCPNCGGGITVGSKICLRCGFNKETGKATKIQVELAGKDKAPKTRSMPKVSFGPGTYLLMLIGLVTGGFVASMFNPEWGIVLYIVATIVLLGAQIWAIVAAFQDDDTIYGILGLVSFCVPFAGLTLIYYGLFRTSREYLKMTTWGALAALILALIGIVGAVPLDEAGLTSGSQPTAAEREVEQPAAPAPTGESLFGG